MPTEQARKPKKLQKTFEEPKNMLTTNQDWIEGLRCVYVLWNGGVCFIYITEPTIKYPARHKVFAHIT